MKILKILGIAVIVGILIFVLIAVKDANSDTNEINKINTVGNINDIEIGNSTQNMTTTNEIIDVNNIQDKYFFGIGKITNIDGNTVSFIENENKKYEITITNNIELVNARTKEKINDTSIIEVGDVIDIDKSTDKFIIGIAKNISGKTLERDLLMGLTFKETELGVGLEKVNIVSKEKAILTINFEDPYAEYFNNHEIFTKNVIVNQTTEIHSKSGLAYNVETLNNATHDFVSIVLDRSTISNEEPIVSYFGSTDT